MVAFAIWKKRFGHHVPSLPGSMPTESWDAYIMHPKEPQDPPWCMCHGKCLFLSLFGTWNVLTFFLWTAIIIKRMWIRGHVSICCHKAIKCRTGAVWVYFCGWPSKKGKMGTKHVVGRMILFRKWYKITRQHVSYSHEKHPEFSEVKWYNFKLFVLGLYGNVFLLEDLKLLIYILQS